MEAPFSNTCKPEPHVLYLRAPSKEFFPGQFHAKLYIWYKTLLTDLCLQFNTKI